MGLRKLGFDPGFGNVTAAEVRGKEIVTATVPSVVGIGTVSTGALNMVGVTKTRRTDIPSLVGFDGVDYLVGRGVAEHAKPIERMDFNRFTDSPELRALLYTVLHQIVNGGESQLALAVGLPVEVLQDKTLATSVEREMKGWLLGTHHFAVDGQPATCEIEAVKVDIAQPLATWFDWGMDESGTWQRGAEGLKAPTLVIDQGFNTLDVIVIENGRFSTRYTGGETLGMRRAAEIALQTLSRRYKLDMSLHEADELVQAVANRRKAEIYVHGKPIDVSSAAKQALNSLVSLVLQFVEKKVGSAARFNVLLTGGGAIALGDRLQEQYPEAEMMADPVLANARGLAKLAQRNGLFG